MVRRAHVSLVLVIGCLACGELLVPSVAIGTYELRSVGGTGLPALLELTPTDSVLVTGRTLTLAADRTFREESRLVVRSRSTGTPRDSVTLEVGAYVPRSGSVALVVDRCHGAPVCALIMYAPVEYRLSGRWLSSDAPLAVRLERTGAPREF